MYTLNANTQKLADVQDAGRGKWMHIYLNDGTSFEGYVSCWTLITADNDEDVDALLFVQRDGALQEVTGAEIERFEVLEEKHRA